MEEGIKLTCNKCKTEFSTRESANKHYSGRWHQFNLMKIFKGMPILTEVEHEDLMNKTTFLQEAKNTVNTHNCRVCKKSFTTQGSFDTHQRSRRHKENVVRKAAENLRRVKIQKEKMVATEKAAKVAAGEVEEEEEEEVEEEEVIDPNNKVSAYCTACKVAFAAEKDYIKHAHTKRHKHMLKAFELAAERKSDLEKQDAEEANATMVEMGEDGEWSDVDKDSDDDDEDAAMSQGDENEEDDEAKPLPVHVCLFCGKRSPNLTVNIGHMERVHSFSIPHQKAADLPELQKYLGEKVGGMLRCIECSKPFQTLVSCRRHMADKPHLTIRFEGEYDQFFELEKIMADVQLPPRSKDSTMDYMVKLPNGSLLTHRDLSHFMNQRLPPIRTAREVKRLTTGVNAKAITHLGKSSHSGGHVAVKKENQRRQRAINVMHKKQDYKYLNVAVKANKLQKHFRTQITGAG